MKVMTVIGTRPEIIKMAAIISELDRNVQHILVHTGQNYDYTLNRVFFEDLGVREPDYYLGAAGSTACETIAKVIDSVEKLIIAERPDAFLVLGDTNSCLCTIAAKKHKVPIFHLEAGNRCFDQRVPEETNRKIIDHISDVNLCFSEHARRNLLAEGLPAATTLKVGSPMKEVFIGIEHELECADEYLLKHKLQAGEYFIASLHREENVDDPATLSKLIEAFGALVSLFKKPLLLSTHPRTRKRLDALAIEMPAGIRVMDAFGFIEYVSLMRNSYCVLSDSGTITEEASILRFPAVTVRQSHERPEGMDEGTVIMTGHEVDNIVRAVNITRKHFDESSAPFETIRDYDTDTVSYKVINIIVSYTDYINRTVWGKK